MLHLIQEFLDVAKNVTTETTEDTESESPSRKINGKRRRWKKMNNNKAKHNPKIMKNNKIKTK